MRMRSAAILAAICGVSLAAAGPTHLVSGLDPSTFDSSVRPQDDLFQYVNGRWLREVTIPGDKAAYGTFAELADRAESDVRGVVEDIVRSGPHRRASIDQQIADLYTSMIDEATVARLGAAPIEPELRTIDAIASGTQLAAEIGRLASIAAGGPFGGSVALDAGNPSRLVVQIQQGGTLLPDREYYLGDERQYVDARAAYTRYLVTIFGLTARADPEGDARAVVALETTLARLEWGQTDSRDPAKASMRFALSDLPKRFPGFDWTAWAKPQGVDRAEAVILSQPSFFRGFAALVPATPMPVWRAWLAARYVTALAPYLSRPFSDARFDFFGRALSGQTEIRVAWKRGVGLVNSFLGDAVGQRYVAVHLSPASKARAERLVANIIDAYRRAVRQVAWMRPGTRQTALDKLARLVPMVGYPGEWRDYSGLVVRPDDLVGNLARARAFDNRYRMARVRDAASHAYWLITPQTVNAYYNPALNEIVVPAAMLQPPLFNPDADDAVNYGAIGAVVGHEIGHALDGLGRQFDATGAARDWWTPADERAFRERAVALVAEFNAFSPMPGLHVNGVLTLGENVGDLGGLGIAYEAYHRSLGGHEAPVLDGFTGDQRFFLSWARIWRAAYHDEYLRQAILTESHAPERYRTNGPVSNLDAFYEAFGVKRGDGLYRDVRDRVRIW